VRIAERRRAMAESGMGGRLLEFSVERGLERRAVRLWAEGSLGGLMDKVMVSLPFFGHCGGLRGGAD
jgi:hypothetical protein